MLCDEDNLDEKEISLELRSEKEKYIEAVRQCLEYFRGEGGRMLEELKRKIHQ